MRAEQRTVLVLPLLLLHWQNGVEGSTRSSTNSSISSDRQSSPVAVVVVVVVLGILAPIILHHSTSKIITPCQLFCGR